DAILKITKRIIGLTRTLFLYRFLQFVSFPLLLFYFIVRWSKEREYASTLRERLGFLPQSFSRTRAGSIWLHAVSVGEVASSVPLLKTLREAEPSTPLYLSTSTSAGRKMAAGVSHLVNGVFFAPFDFRSCVRRVLQTIRPSLLVIVETELWPNLFAETKRAGAALVIVNGRISQRAWPKYKRWRRLFAPVLRLPDLVFVQSRTDYDRYLKLGVPAAKLQIEANLKYDISATAMPLQLPTFGAEQIWIAASTVGPNERGSLSRHNVDEDDIVLSAFQELSLEFPRTLLVLAPRQPARFLKVAVKLQNRNIRFARRSTAEPLQLPGVLLLDTMGELARLYPLADVVFVGGSLAPRGGHNIIEPAAAGAPVVIGPHMQNFEAIASDFKEAGAVVQIRREADLLPAIRNLLLHREQAQAMGERGQRVVEEQRGVSQRIAPHLLRLHQLGERRASRRLLTRSVFGALSLLWQHGGAIKRHRAERYARSVESLPVPVISIGGITVGGSGKTPFTTYLAVQLRERGFSPAILTRGYRRRSPARSLVIAAGAKVPTAFTGDEAQIFLRAGIAPVGIGANRYRTAQLLLSRFPQTNVLLLDDGFQHARIRRDVDVVLIDALDPFGGAEVVPAGRLREPLTALGGADIFVITRCDSHLRFETIVSKLRQYNAEAPVFRTRFSVHRWRDLRTGAVLEELPETRVAAFCGLGNPQSFWNTLEMLGVEVVFRWTFDDHHAYKPVELRRLAEQARQNGAKMLVTTEKDLINLPNQAENALGEFSLAWLEIELKIEGEERFFEILGKSFSYL
ncbi:MAG: tetraacyldisaccharide 4'-kinase, partial [Acidobacteriaceae bacterium]|nr:tetraacyldisaccharide 4'-kinase [Acidobacteriaceae bacterium]